MEKRVESKDVRKNIDNNKKMIKKEIDKKVWETIDKSMKKAGFKKVEG